VTDKSSQPASSYNWDKTTPVADPNADEFFNTLIEDKKVGDLCNESSIDFQNIVNN